MAEIGEMMVPSDRMRWDARHHCWHLVLPFHLQGVSTSDGHLLQSGQLQSKDRPRPVPVEASGGARGTSHMLQVSATVGSGGVATFRRPFSSREVQAADRTVPSVSSVYISTLWYRIYIGISLLDL